MLAKSKFAEIVGKNIRKHRENGEISQEELAEKCKFYRTYIGLLENGRHVPSAYTLYRIAKALNISINELYPSTV